MFQREEIRHLGLFYLNGFMGSVSLFFAPFIVVYLQSQGLSFFEISTILAAIMITPLIFEVPTGVVADKYGRRFSVILGQFLIALVSFSIPFLDGYFALLIGFVVWGAVITLVSGADSAWVVDNLKSRDREDLITHYFMKITSITLLGTVLAAFIASFIVKYVSLSSIWFFQGAVMFVASFILLFQKEFGVYEGSKNVLRESLDFLSKRNIFLFLVGLMFMQLTFSAFGLVWQPFLVSFGLELHQLGYVLGGITLITIPLPLLSKRVFDKFNGPFRFLFLAAILQGVFGVLLMFANILPTILLLMIMVNVIATVTRPMFSVVFHDMIPSRIRATSGSVFKMIFGLASAVTLLFGGYVAQVGGMSMAFLVGGVLSMIGGIVFLVIGRKGFVV